MCIRDSIITWNIVKKLLPLEKIESIHIHRVEKDIEKDTWAIKYKDEEIKKYNMTFSSWFKTKEEFHQHLKNCDIFIAPRLFEGIGMTFLEAMALGKCVVSPNFPTMNEYIVHNKTGLLFDMDNISKLDLSNVYEIGQNAQNYIKKGYEQWINTHDKIFEFIEKKTAANVNKKFQNAIENLKSINCLNNKQKESLNLILKFANMVYEDETNENTLTNFFPKENESLIFSKYLNLLYLQLQQIKYKIIIYGAGNVTRLILPHITDKVEFIVDMNKNLWNKQINNIPIKNPEELKNNKDTKILITVLGREEGIIKYLTKRIGIQKKNIIVLKVKDFKPW
jgi:hypothetical protein